MVIVIVDVSTLLGGGVTVVGLKDPLNGDGIDEVSNTGELKLFNEVIETLYVTEEPLRPVCAVGVAVILKSGRVVTINDTSSEFDCAPLVPVILSVYVPADAVQGTPIVKVVVVPPVEGVTDAAANE